MKTVSVATDFSKEAENAQLYILNFFRPLHLPIPGGFIGVTVGTGSVNVRHYTTRNQNLSKA